MEDNSLANCLVYPSILRIYSHQNSLIFPPSNIFLINYSYKSVNFHLIWIHSYVTLNIFIQVACIIVAALLHYFLLATFCWMLCEGIKILMMVMFVFYKGVFQKMFFFLFVGWGKCLILHCLKFVP